MDTQKSQDILEAGTGFMASLSETMRKLHKKGYTENLTPKRTHFEAQSGAIRLYPEDFVIDEVVRFENTSDPDDQSILYLISSPEKGLKGLFVESFGVYNEGLSPELQEKMKEHPH